MGELTQQMKRLFQIGEQLKISEKKDISSQELLPKIEELEQLYFELNNNKEKIDKIIQRYENIYGNNLSGKFNSNWNKLYDFLYPRKGILKKRSVLSKQLTSSGESKNIVSLATSLSTIILTIFVSLSGESAAGTIEKNSEAMFKDLEKQETQIKDTDTKISFNGIGQDKKDELTGNQIILEDGKVVTLDKFTDMVLNDYTLAEKIGLAEDLNFLYKVFGSPDFSYQVKELFKKSWLEASSKNKELSLVDFRKKIVPVFHKYVENIEEVSKENESSSIGEGEVSIARNPSLREFYIGARKQVYTYILEGKMLKGPLSGREVRTLANRYGSYKVASSRLISDIASAYIQAGRDMSEIRNHI